MTVMSVGIKDDGGPVAPINVLVHAWGANDAVAFGRPFSAQAIFVAFDGTVLRGPEAICRFHAEAFRTHLAGTQLHLDIDEARVIAPDVTLVLTHGGIRGKDAAQGPLIGPSIQTFVIREEKGRFSIESFHNTRARAITGPRQAQVWRDFDQAWGNLTGSNATS